MTPTLIGRLQSRAIVVLVVGLAWTFLITPLLPVDEMALGEAYGVTFQAVILTVVLGLIFWEPVYHLIQQYRWEKDWPTGLGLITGIPEGIVVYLIMSSSGPVPGAAFFWHFLTTWLLVWFTLNGPVRVLWPRWRFSGGRFF